MNYLTKSGFFLFCIFVFAGILFQGCSKDDNESSVTLSISGKKVTFTQDARTKDITIYTSSKWSSRSNASWLAISPASSSETSATVTVQVTANTEKEARSGYVAVGNSEGKRDTIHVLQTGTDPMIAISQTSSSVVRAGGTVNVMVASNVGDWEISSDVQWIKLPTVTSSTANCTFTIVPNAYEQRTGKVYFKQTDGTVSAELTITQAEATENLDRGADSMALVRFYRALLGDGWDRKWDLAAPITSWAGITVVDGRVVAISLNNNKLKGEIPAEIAALSELQSVSLEGNQLTGSLPSGLSSLKNLVTLNLSKNSFSGSMPKVIQQMTTLKSLNVSYNNYTDFIDFSSLTNLEELTVTDNNTLTAAIPKTIAKLTKMIKLDLSNNALSGSIPDELKQLAGLSSLDLSFNQLTGSIPSSISSLTKLTNLDLQANQFSGSIPSSIGSLSGLKILLLNDNQLTGEIAAAIGKLTNLETLLLNGNGLSGSIPAESGNLQRLKALYLNDNELTGTIPSELAKITTLKTLNLLNNRLSKPIPDAIRAMDQSFFYLCTQKDNVDICE